MARLAQVVEWKTGNPKVQGSHLTPLMKLCVSGHGLPLIQNFLSKVWECDGEDGRAVD